MIRFRTKKQTDGRCLVPSKNLDDITLNDEPESGEHYLQLTSFQQGKIAKVTMFGLEILWELLSRSRQDKIKKVFTNKKAFVVPKFWVWFYCDGFLDRQIIQEIPEKMKDFFGLERKLLFRPQIIPLQILPFI